MMHTLTVNPRHLSRSLGGEYQSTPDYRWMHRRHRPLFSRWWTEQMLTSSTIHIGLEIIKGSILKGQHEILTDDEDLHDLLERMTDKFMTIAAYSVLEALEWGFSVHEMIYEPNLTPDDDKFSGIYELCDFIRYKPSDTRIGVDTRTNLPKGFFVPKIKKFIKPPKSLHFVHKRNLHRTRGRSILHGAFQSWVEEWSIGGLRDICKLWFAKNCYRSGTVYHPPGSQNIDGVSRPNHLVAQEMGQQYATGHVVTIQLEEGKSIDVTKGGMESKWYIEPAEAQNVPAGMLERLKELELEQWEGMGIPREVLDSGGEGMGSSTGRSIPVDVFFAGLQCIFNDLTWTMNRQYLKPMVQYNWQVMKGDGAKVPAYEVRAKNLNQDAVMGIEDDNEELKDHVDQIEQERQMAEMQEKVTIAQSEAKETNSDPMKKDGKDTKGSSSDKNDSELNRSEKVEASEAAKVQKDPRVSQQRDRNKKRAIKRITSQ